MPEITSMEDIARLQSASDLQCAVRQHNWDDGFDIPLAIAEHPQCDLAVALELFSISDAMSVYLGEAERHAYNGEWIAFCRLITDRILAGYYKPGMARFRTELGAVQIYKLRKRGVPELLINSFPAESE